MDCLRPRSPSSDRESNTHGRIALHDAARARSYRQTRDLIKGADITAVDEGGRTALHIAAKSGSDHIVSICLANGANIGVTDSYGRTALHYAAQSGSNNMVWRLLRNGANIAATDDDGRTALHYAAQVGSNNIILTLLAKGADIAVASSDSRTALHEAAKAGSADAVWTLLNKGAAIDAVDKNGRTALHEASRAAADDTVWILLNRGADITATDRNGRTALHEAVQAFLDQYGQRTLFKTGEDQHYLDSDLLRERVASIALLHGDQSEASQGAENSVYLLLDQGTDITATDQNGRTALHEAAHAGSHELINYLLDNGADITATDQNERTALHDAAHTGSYLSIDCLLRNGADVTATDKNGRTALHEAAHTGSYEVAQRLIKFRADVSALDHQDKSPLSITLEQSHVLVAILLIQSGANLDISWDHESDGVTFTLAERMWLRPPSQVDRVSLMRLLIMLARYHKGVIPSNQEELYQYILYQWEVPTVLRKSIKLSRVSTNTPSESVYDALSNSVVITGSNGLFKYTTCGDFLSDNWDETGLDALRVASQVLESMMDRIPKQRIEKPSRDIAKSVTVLSVTEDFIALMFNHSTYDTKAFTEAMQWLCSAIRPLSSSFDDPNQALDGLRRSEVSLIDFTIQGRRLCQCSLAELTSLDIGDVGSNSCWVHLFRSGIVSWWPISRKWGDGLELSFSTLVDLAAVENYVFMPQDEDQPNVADPQRSGGFILIGYFTALIPTAQDIGNNSIQWHLECSKDIFDLGKLAISQDWVRVQDYTTFKKAKCFLGWGDPVNILLGTRIPTYNLRWSRSNEHTSRRRAEGSTFGFELGLREVLPIIPKITAEREYKMRSVVQRFNPQDQYDKAVVHLSKQVGFIFDTATQRAWLVPLLSLMLHLCHVYFAHFNRDGNKQDPVPFADALPDGASAALAALMGRRNQEVFETITLGNVLLGIYTNLKASVETREDPTRSTIYAAEAMDQLDEPLRGSPLKSMKLGAGSHAWLGLVQLADFVCFCADLGEAMQPQRRDPADQCKCHILPKDKYLLAAHNSCLEILMSRKGAKLEDLQSDVWEINEKEFLILRELPVTNCTHNPDRPFWSHCIPYLQTSRCRLAARPSRKCPGLAEPPRVTGAVVFGGSAEVSITDRVFR